MIDLKRVRDVQVDRLIDLGFNRQIGLSPSAYRQRFPEILPKPTTYDQRFDVFLVVEADPSLSLKFQHQAVGIVEFVDSDKLTTVGFRSRTPYYIWTHEGKKYKTKSIGSAIEAFPEDERPCSQLEVTSLFVHHPEHFKGCGIDSGRTYHKDNYYSTLIWVEDHPDLALHHLNDFTPGLSLLSRGKLREEG
jgi:hypothetical protein